MKRLAIAAVGLALVVGVAVAVVAVWASVAEAPWERTTSSHPSPTPTVQSLDDEMVGVARQFLHAWKTPNHDAMKALLDEDGTIVSGTPIDHYPWRALALSEWAHVSSENLCDGFLYQARLPRPSLIEGLTPAPGVSLEFPACTAYEIVNVVVGKRSCKVPTPAEAANGHGKTCTYWLAYAYRSSSHAPYRDGDFCVTVRVKNSVPMVTDAEDDSRCE